ncbi:hypothetical protein AVEN_155309-1 [Araneus ventricosus]|uniref:Histone-lysine N-methyltransferase SETMAR n=1 Tax=Araneus ventricosus TaxID=182803 RepID=A0A4Y2D6B4_ARAVE|nr:hypothetical protein AVEN_155309-1 [Araneus ventricosus]
MHGRRAVLRVSIDYLPMSAAVNADCYCTTQENLRRAIQRRRSGVFRDGIVLLHYNAQHHESLGTPLLQKLRWELFFRPTYSSDLGPINYNLFQHLKRFLAGTNPPVTTFHSLTADFFDTGTQKFISGYHTCFSSDGSSVER